MRVSYDKIIIPENRYRKDMGDLNELAESISITKGNIVPVIVRDNKDGTYTLVAGERRVRASMIAKTDVLITVKTDEEINDKVYEIVENIDRKAFTWQEQVKATKELHNMLCALKGPDWSGRKTAEEVKLSVGGICTDLNLAEAIEKMPELFLDCKTKQSALKALQRYKVEEAIVELVKRKSGTDYDKKARNYVFKGDCNVLIESIPYRSINSIISDPKYGLNIEAVSKSTDTSAPVKIYDDDPDDYKELMSEFIPKASLRLTEDSSFCMFTDVNHFHFIRDLWVKEGFIVDPLPLIWHRIGPSGQTNCPERFFGRVYEIAVYGTRGNMSIVRHSSNVIALHGVNPYDKEHPLQKPLEVMEEIISRFCLPGHTILDFMCGSGTTIVAAIKRGCKAIGFEIDETYYNIALNRISDAIKAKDAGMLDVIE